jgi:hypothetical protein
MAAVKLSQHWSSDGLIQSHSNLKNNSKGNYCERIKQKKSILYLFQLNI